ncbi:MAG: Beta-ketoadipate enol-lactone hydrolase [Myxococcaceae bacterium]|nr:Beta-ketoadipate enol-lactone hydrolase [Myxococcaceae bacterium]
MSALADQAGSVELPGGGFVAFEVHGARHGGVPVLLLRPMVGAMALWGGFRDALAARARVIAFDPRGTGASSDAPADATTRDLARDAVALLDALGEPVAHVFGISFGAMIATWIAVDAPARVARLCLASAGPVGFALTASGVGRALEMTATALVPGDEAVTHLVGEVLSADLREGRPSRVAAVEAAAATAPADRVEVLKHAVAAARHDASAELHRVVARTLVLAGDRDELIGDAPTAALAAAIPGARLEVVANAGHDLTLERPAETAAIVADFLLADD